MSFMDYLKKGWEVVQLKGEAVDQLAQDEKAFGPAIGVLAIGGVCAAIGMLNPPGIILMPIMRLVGYFIFIAIVHFGATALFHGKGDFKAMFNPPAIASFISWISIIPLLGTVLAVLTGLWMLVISVVTVERVYGLDRGKAIVTVAIPIVILMVIWAIFAAIFGAAMLMMMGR